MQKKLNRQFRLWDGACQVHIIFSEEALIKLSVRYPEAKLLAHPECNKNILQHADHIGSTTSIINFARNNNNNLFIIATEPGVIHQMKKENPDKKFIPLPNNKGCSCNECPYMRLNTLAKMYNALNTLEPEIIIPEKLRLKALKPLQRMIELS